MGIRGRVLPAGWYPESAEACRREIEDFGSYFRQFESPPGPKRGGVVPHAGWYFSGKLAGLVFHLTAQEATPEVVVVFGGHLGPGTGRIFLDEGWATPLGTLEADTDLAEVLKDRAGLRVEGPEVLDNTVEIQLPLVKYFFPESRLLALRAPHSQEALALGREVAALAQEQGKTILAFGSSDLTHYGPNYGFLPKGRGPEALTWVREENDKGFIDRAVAMDGPGLLDHAAQTSSACSAGAVAAAAAACQALGASEGLLVDYYTSYDLMPGDSFVGYAGILY